MKMSADGRAKLIQREGLKTTAYKDTEGVWTIGVGHTKNAGLPHPVAGMIITRAEAIEIFTRDLVRYENIVNRNVRAPLTQGQFDALVSICFNVEVALSPKSTIVKCLNKRDYAGAARAIMLYKKPPAIIGRRRSEQQQFIQATYAQIAERKREAGAPEKLTTKDIRSAGSRTIAGADEVKSGVVGGAATATGAAVTAAVNSGVDPSDVISKVSDAAEQAKNIHDAAQAAPDMWATVQTHWEWIVIAVLACACAYFIWRAWRGAGRITRAKVEDTNEALAIFESDAGDAFEEAQ
jgi:lysozyme